MGNTTGFLHFGLPRKKKQRRIALHNTGERDNTSNNCLLPTDDIREESRHRSSNDLTIKGIQVRIEFGTVSTASGHLFRPAPILIVAFRPGYFLHWLCCFH
jgi:hypothetical protein